MKIQRVFVLLAIGALIWLTPPQAQGRSWWSGASQSGSYEVQVLVDGVPCPTYHQHGRTYVEGRISERYVIRVHNRSWRRIEAIIAVDGRDVIDGKSSQLSKRGYVIPAYSYIDVDGWRISMDEVAAFRFTTVPDSYASRTGTPWSVGIIGVAVFPERTRRRPRRPPYISGKRKRGPGNWDSAADEMSESKAPATRSHNIGTRFGERRASAVSETRFVRQNWSRPAARLSIRYDDRSGLCGMGVGSFCYPPYPPWPPPYDPPPYDPHQQNRDFADPPPGWDHFSPWY